MGGTAGAINMSDSWNSNEPMETSDTISLVRYETGDESSSRRMKQAYIAFHTEAVVRSHGGSIKNRGLNRDGMMQSKSEGQGWQSCSGKVQMHADEWALNGAVSNVEGRAWNDENDGGEERITDHTEHMSDTVWKHN
jgi:glutamine phosphoribosylpyrophosphate amidotransferase